MSGNVLYVVILLVASFILTLASVLVKERTKDRQVYWLIWTGGTLAGAVAWSMIFGAILDL